MNTEKQVEEVKPIRAWASLSVIDTICLVMIEKEDADYRKDVLGERIIEVLVTPVPPSLEAQEKNLRPCVACGKIHDATYSDACRQCIQGKEIAQESHSERSVIEQLQSDNNRLRCQLNLMIMETENWNNAVKDIIGRIPLTGINLEEAKKALTASPEHKKEAGL